MGTITGLGHRGFAPRLPASGAAGFWPPGRDSPAALSTAKADRSLNARAEKRVEVPNELTNLRRFMKGYLYEEVGFSDSVPPVREYFSDFTSQSSSSAVRLTVLDI
jgi:hypothetical protein